MASYYTLNEFSVGMKDGIDMVRVTIQVASTQTSVVDVLRTSFDGVEEPM